jgi:hypothetical protein
MTRVSLRALTVATGLLALPATAASQFIVRDQQYRCPKADPTCATSVTQLPAFESRPNATINYVEIKDDGTFWDRRQLDDALEQIGVARQNGAQKPLVFVYIHGWQNNADESRANVGETDCLKLHGDVAKFRTCGVDRLADRSLNGVTRPVVGIYLAWRGLSSNVEPFKHLFSYWPRRNKARLVGRKGMFESLQAIIRKVGEHRDDYTLMMIGHSFGARVLEYAAEAVDPGQQHCGFMERFRRRFSRDAAGLCPSTAGDASLGSTDVPVDLFVYVNSASSHRMTLKALRDWERICADTPSHAVCSADPLYLATSSHTDYATAFLLPVANAIGPAFRADRFHLISAANTSWLHTHADPRKVPSCPPLASGSFCFEDPRHGAGEGPVVYYAEMHRDPQQRRFWLFNTGRRLIRNHGDVWNERVFNLVMAVLDRRLTATGK